MGGPATTGCGWVPEFLGFCQKNQVPVDFVSTHTYGVESGFLDETGTAGTATWGSEKDVNQLNELFDGMEAFCKRTTTPAYIGEFSMCSNKENASSSPPRGFSRRLADGRRCPR